jgi:hypothetical protein
MKKITLNVPPKAKLDEWRQMTDGNDHTEARRDICGWLMDRLYEQYPNDEYSGAADFHRVFTAIKAIHEDAGHLFQDLCEYRYKKTEELIAFVREINPDAADAIYNTL